jgi:hypothetical protein
MKCLCIAFGAMAALASTASAQLDGRPITADWYYPSFGSSIETHDLVVGPDIELRPEDITNDDSFSIDIGDDTITFLLHDASTWTETGFNGRFTPVLKTRTLFVSYTFTNATSANPA